MQQLHRHLQALQGAATVTLVSVSLIGLPLFAADKTETTGFSHAYYAEHLVSLFQRTGAATSR